MPSAGECLSQFPALEPLAGAALTLSLAYLNLERFRYRAKIREHARQELSRFRAADGLERLRKNKWYRQVERLAALPDNDKLSPKTLEEVAKKAGLETTSNGNGNSKIHMPDGMWGKIYQLIFSFHQDRVASYIFTGIALLALLLGCAHSVGLWHFAECLGQGTYVEVMFYLLICGTLGPISFVILGRRVVLWATDFASESVSELEGLMQNNAQEAVNRAAPQLNRMPLPPRHRFPGGVPPNS